MFDHFSTCHLLALFIASTMTFGGMWPLFDAKAAILEFGFPARYADTQATHPVMAAGSVRTTVLGLLTFIFYLQQKYAEVDTILAVFGAYAGSVDSYLVWKAGNGRKAAFRFVASWAIAACGFAGLTASRVT
ncbi:hypothetical protein SCUP234_07212 [Seiridium cupressi]